MSVNKWFLRVHTQTQITKWIMYPPGFQPPRQPCLYSQWTDWRIDYAVPPYIALLFASRWSRQDKIRKADIADLTASLMASATEPTSQNTKHLIRFFNSIDLNAIGADPQLAQWRDLMLRDQTSSWWHNNFAALDLSTKRAVLDYLFATSAMYEAASTTFSHYLEMLYPASRKTIGVAFRAFATVHWNGVFEKATEMVEAAERAGEREGDDNDELGSCASRNFGGEEEGGVSSTRGREVCEEDEGSDEGPARKACKTSS